MLGHTHLFYIVLLLLIVPRGFVCENGMVEWWNDRAAVEELGIPACISYLPCSPVTQIRWLLKTTTELPLTYTFMVELPKTLPGCVVKPSVVDIYIYI